MVRPVAYLVEHTSTVDIALMWQNLGNVFFQHLARGHEQLPDRAFGSWCFVALYRRLQANHESCDMFAWSTEHDHFKSFVGVEWDSESALAAGEGFGELCCWFE